MVIVKVVINDKVSIFGETAILWNIASTSNLVLGVYERIQCIRTASGSVARRFSGNSYGFPIRWVF